MKPNITPVTLIRGKDKVIIMNNLFKVKLLCSGRSVLQRFTIMELFLPTFFLVNSKETVLPGSCLQQVLKYYTAKYYTVKYWESITIPCALQIRFSEKVKNVQEKCQCRSPVSVMLNCDFIIARLHHGYFSRNVPTFFTIFICLVSQ